MINVTEFSSLETGTIGSEGYVVNQVNSSSVDPFVRIDRVTKIYETKSGPVHAVEDVSLDIGRGEFVAIVGPSGCGKSTLMLMTAGLIPYSGGTIAIDKTVVKQPYTDLGIVF